MTHFQISRGCHQIFRYFPKSEKFDIEKWLDLEIESCLIELKSYILYKKPVHKLNKNYYAIRSEFQR